jgi:hypothetical protein
VAVELRIYLGDLVELGDLREWMTWSPGVVLRTVPGPADPQAQGGGWEFLCVLCAAGGPAVAALGALQLWIEAHVTVVEFEVGDIRFKVRSAKDAPAVFSQAIETAKVLELGSDRNDGSA